MTAQSTTHNGSPWFEIKSTSEKSEWHWTVLAIKPWPWPCRPWVRPLIFPNSGRAKVWFPQAGLCHQRHLDIENTVWPHRPGSQQLHGRSGAGNHLNPSAEPHDSIKKALKKAFGKSQEGKDQTLLSLNNLGDRKLSNLLKTWRIWMLIQRHSF